MFPLFKFPSVGGVPERRGGRRVCFFITNSLTTSRSDDRTPPMEENQNKKTARKNSGGWRFVTILTEIVCLFDIFAALQPNYSWRFYVIVDAVRNGLRHPIRKTLSDGVHSIKKYFILQRNKTRPDFHRVLFYLELTAFNFQRTAISRHFLTSSGILSLTQIVSTSSLFFKPTTSI